jgi:hypothetical protein
MQAPGMMGNQDPLCADIRFPDESASAKQLLGGVWKQNIVQRMGLNPRKNLRVVVCSCGAELGANLHIERPSTGCGVTRVLHQIMACSFQQSGLSEKNVYRSAYR